MAGPTEHQNMMFQAAKQSELSVYGRLVFIRIITRPDLHSAYTGEVLQLSQKDQSIIVSLVEQDILESCGSRQVKQIKSIVKHQTGCCSRRDQKDQIRERMRGKLASRASPSASPSAP